MNGSDTINYENEYFSLLDKYNELIYAVERKFPNETRHQTALRYILEIENSKFAPVMEVKPWVEPRYEKRDWNVTPIVPEEKQTLNG